VRAEVLGVPLRVRAVHVLLVPLVVWSAISASVVVVLLITAYFLFR
jgi:hypothetical protein